jgi:hypothetical protein
MARIRERVPRDQFGIPIHRREAAEPDMYEEPEPDSSEVVDFDADTSPAFLLGKLETLQTVYKDVMPNGCRSSVRKGLAILQRFVSPKSESARRNHVAGVVEQLLESVPPSHDEDDEFLFAPPRTFTDSELANFASQLR